jgi:hypothetical protein
MQNVWLPELAYVDGEFRKGVAVISDRNGLVVAVRSSSEIDEKPEAFRTFSLKNKALPSWSD